MVQCGRLSWLLSAFERTINILIIFCLICYIVVVGSSELTICVFQHRLRHHHHHHLQQQQQPWYGKMIRWLVEAAVSWSCQLAMETRFIIPPPPAPSVGLFRLFTKESLTRIERRIQEERAAKHAHDNDGTGAWLMPRAVYPRGVGRAISHSFKSGGLPILVISANFCCAWIVR